jgi:hypothetical protein
MIFKNFKLSTNPQAVEIESEGHFFDLHNQGEFQGLRFDTVNRRVEFDWKFFGDRASSDLATHRIILQIVSVSFLAITPWDEAKPPGEASCLFGISRVVLNNDKVRFRAHWEPSDDSHLLFEFMSGQTIEVSGDMAMVQVSEIGSQ